MLTAGLLKALRTHRVTSQVSFFFLQSEGASTAGFKEDSPGTTLAAATYWLSGLDTMIVLL